MLAAICFFQCCVLIVWTNFYTNCVFILFTFLLVIYVVCILYLADVVLCYFTGLLMHLCFPMNILFSFKEEHIMLKLEMYLIAPSPPHCLQFLLNH